MTRMWQFFTSQVKWLLKLYQRTTRRLAGLRPAKLLKPTSAKLPPSPPSLDSTSNTSISTLEGHTSLPVIFNPPSVDSRDSWPDLAEHLTSFVRHQNSPHTQRAYGRDLEEFLHWLKTHQRPLTIHTLVDYREHLEHHVRPGRQTPLSRVSINRRIATLKSFLNWLVLTGVIPHNPAKALKSFRAGRESPTRDIANDRVKVILDLPNRGRPSGSLHHAILMVLFHLGLRRSELTALRCSDIFETQGVRVLRVRGKGDKERLLPIPEAVWQSISNYLRMAKKSLKSDDVLFTPTKNNCTQDKSKPLNPSSVTYLVKRYARRAGVSYRVSPHSARATAVSNALDNKAPHRAVQHMAGWASPLMVTRYDKRKADLKNSAVTYIDYEGST